MKKKPIKNQCGKREVRTTPRHGAEVPPLVPEDIQINKITYKLTTKKQKYFPNGGNV